MSISLGLRDFFIIFFYQLGHLFTECVDTKGFQTGLFEKQCSRELRFKVIMIEHTNCV